MLFAGAPAHTACKRQTNTKYTTVYHDFCLWKIVLAYVMIENSETGNLKNEEGIIMRESGILMPVSSLPGPYGIGCFGAEALKFVDFLAAAGQHIWQLLPLSPTGYGDSPYQSCSAFAGNPYFIDLDALKADGLLTAAQLKAEPWGTDPLSVDYGTLYTSRYKVLRAAYAAWREKYAGRFGCAHYYPDDYYAFTLTNESWLNDYAMYMALKTANGMKSWAEWPREYRLRDAGALAEFAAGQEEEIGFWKFLQYEFAVQWKKVKDYANEKGIKILGDIPIYVSADSVDAWVGGELFELDAQGGFARVAGCPPDMHGGCAAFAMPSGSTTCSASTTSEALTPTGPSRQAAPPPAPASGRTAPAWSCSMRWKRPSASCPSSPKIWATSCPVSASCWPTALSRA